jgi:hypothetical protein
VNTFKVDVSKFVEGFGKIDLNNFYNEVSKDVETFEKSEYYQNWLLNAEKRKAEKIATNLLKQAKNIEKFRNFELMYVYELPYNLLRYNKEQNEVQTSSGVKISLPVFMRYYNKLKNNDLNKGEKIEHYTYLGKDDKTVFVGCHTIELTEIENIINQLG